MHAQSDKSLQKLHHFCLCLIVLRFCFVPSDPWGRTKRSRIFSRSVSFIFLVNKAWSVSFPWRSLSVLALHVLKQVIKALGSPFQIIEDTDRLFGIQRVLGLSPGQKGRKEGLVLQGSRKVVIGWESNLQKAGVRFGTMTTVAGIQGKAVARFVVTDAIGAPRDIHERPA